MSRRGQFAVGAALWIAVVAPLALLVHGQWSPLLDLDRSIVDDLQPRTADSSLVRGVASVVTTAGTSWFRFLVLAPVVVWAWRTARRRLAWLVLVAAGLIGPLTTGLKLLVGRERPDFPDPVYLSDSLSHPSGHSSGIATLVALLLVALLRLQRPRTRWLTVGGGVLLVIAVGLTRIALGAHYPSDVVAGYALGAGWVLMLTAGFDAAPRPVEETTASPPS
ncbi:MAG: phosphatase PAP2 family protein [Geodermatophilaceae bacterium]|nr:phosphatase PAP2 family protein [Geodermatophilaceae bacterium]